MGADQSGGIKMYINEWGQREADWYEVKRYLKGSNGNDDGSGTTCHKTRKQAEKAKAEAIKTGKYEAVFIDHIAENSGIID